MRGMRLPFVDSEQNVYSTNTDFSTTLLWSSVLVPHVVSSVSTVAVIVALKKCNVAVF